MHIPFAALQHGLAAQVTAAAVLLAVTITPSSIQAQPVGRYSAVEYDRIEHPGSSAVVRRINTFREVAAGYYKRADPRRISRGLVLTGTDAIDVTGDQFTDYSTAYGINDRGETVGALNTATALRPFRSVRRSAFQELPLLPGDTGGAAFAINDSGEAVGYSSGSSGERAVWWTRAGAVRELPGLPGASTRALGVNDRGDIVGASGDEQKRAVLWLAKGNVVNLGTLPGFAESEAVSINERGDIVGFASGVDDAPYRSRAVLWAPGGQAIRDLGVLTGGADSRARDINMRGEVVGTSTSSGGRRAFIWTAAGGMVDLNTLVSLPGLVLTDALSVNRNGDIVAVGQEQHHDAPGTGGHSHDDGHEVPRRVLVLTPGR